MDPRGAEGLRSRKADIAKPLKGLGPGVMEMEIDLVRMRLGRLKRELLS